MGWYLMALRKYAVFSGRSRRKEYWFFVLFNVIIAIVLGILDATMGMMTATGVGILGAIFSLAMIIPGIAVTVRRLHDTGRTGWWILIVLVPLVGWLVLLVFMFFDSEPSTNQYGPSPKAA